MVIFGEMFETEQKVPYTRYFLCVLGRKKMYQKWVTEEMIGMKLLDAVFVCLVNFRFQNTEHRILKFWEYGN